MATKGKNKGEWSEFYAFIKILTDGELFAADENLEIIKDKFFTVLKIIREEKEGIKAYDISGKNGKVIITDSEGKLLSTVSLDNIKKKVTDIFSEIKNSSGTTFKVTLAKKAMAELHCTQIKAASSKKSDLIIVLHDRISPTFSELGFSIKSMLGSPSTLLNASGSTNFIYRVVENRKDEKLEGSGEALTVRDKTKEIYGNGGYLEFLGMDSEGFRKNLRKIDSCLPDILAEIMKHYYNGNGMKISELVACLAKDEEFCKKLDLGKSDFEYKIKNFLSAIALGMTPQKEWDGFTKAHGGYIIVKENGEVVCYHLYNRDEFEEYLFANTKLDTPSTTRHKFGSFYKEKGEKRIKYNLQIRFIK